MAYVACAVAVVGVAGALYSADQASEASDAAAGRAINQNTYEGALQKNLKEQESADMIATSKIQAGKVLGAAQYMRSAQMAQSAGSGVLVGEGSSQVMQDRTTELAMQDALAALYSGARGAASNNTAGEFAVQTANARSASAAAQNASNQAAIKTQATVSIASSLLGGYSSYQSGQAKTKKEP